MKNKASRKDSDKGKTPHICDISCGILPGDCPIAWAGHESRAARAQLQADREKILGTAAERLGLSRGELIKFALAILEEDRIAEKCREIGGEIIADQLPPALKVLQSIRRGA